jgi:hypothetical protein
VTTWIHVCPWLCGWMAISAAGCEMFASSAAPHRIGSPRADVRRAHGRSALSDAAHRMQPEVHPDFNVRVLRCYYAYCAHGTDRYPPFRPQNVSDHRPILTGTAATSYPGAALTKAVAAGDPQRRSLAVRAAEPGRHHNLCAGFGAPAQRQPRIEDPPPRREGSS